MIDAVGLDIGESTAAAACRRGDAVEPALVVPTADLDGPTLHDRLASLAVRVVGSDTVAAIAVAVAPLDAATHAAADAEARAAFPDPVLVPRPLAAARWFTHANDVHPDAVLVIVEAEDDCVVVTAVRSWAVGPGLERPPAGYAASG